MANKHDLQSHEDCLQSINNNEDFKIIFHKTSIKRLNRLILLQKVNQKTNPDLFEKIDGVVDILISVKEAHELEVNKEICDWKLINEQVNAVREKAWVTARNLESDNRSTTLIAARLSIEDDAPESSIDQAWSAGDIACTKSYAAKSARAAIDSARFSIFSSNKNWCAKQASLRSATHATESAVKYAFSFAKTMVDGEKAEDLARDNSWKQEMDDLIEIKIISK